MKRISIILSVLAALTSCGTKQVNNINVIPYPEEVKVMNGTFNAAGADFHIDAEADQLTQELIKAFAAQLELASGQKSRIDDGKGNGFTFDLNKGMDDEEYTIRISGDKVRIQAAGLRGFNYAIQTIKQMLPAQIFGKDTAADLDWSLPCVKINDAPRFRYRGMLMDVSRQFFDVEEVKRYLDIMEVH